MKQAYPAPKTDTAIVTPTPTIGSDIRLTLRVGGVIEEHFDREKRLYHLGWSDERVAKETSAALDFVLKVRKEGFGELAEDPEMTRLRLDIKALEDHVTEVMVKLSGSVDEIKTRFDRMSHHKAAG
jgi:hypothetical protein